MLIGRRTLHTTASNSKFFRIHWWPYFKRWQQLEKEQKQEVDEKLQLREAGRISDEFYITPQKPEQGEFSLFCILSLNSF